MGKQAKIRISLKGAGLSYEGSIDDALAGQIMTLCLSSQDPGSPQISRTPHAPLRPSAAQRESGAEYLNRHAPKRNPDKILTLAGFLKEHHSKDAFAPGEIKSLFRDAGEMLPGNFGRDFKWVVNNGWIAPDSSKKGSYYITNTGLKVLNGGFPEDLVKKTKGKFSGRKKSKQGNK